MGKQDMHVCYFGKYDPTYPRNAVIRKGLAHNGVEVVECHIDSGLGAEQYRGLLAQMRRVKGHLDVILVAEHNQFAVPLAWAWARQLGVPLVFDPFTSLYDSDVFDRRVVPPNTFRARRRYWLDWVSMRLADKLLADTDQHRAYYATTFGVQAERIVVVPIGADDHLFYPRSQVPSASAGFHVLFWGTYIPLHGIEYILQAARLVRDNEITFTLIGDGQTYQEMANLAGRLNLVNVHFVSRAALTDIPPAVARADICLGIFGRTAKASRVVPNKVYEALALRKPVITRDSPALREFFTPGEHLWAAPMADSQALAEAILALEGNPALREALAAQGHARFCERFTPRVIGHRVKQLLDQIVW